MDDFATCIKGLEEKELISPIKNEREFDVSANKLRDPRVRWIKKIIDIIINYSEKSESKKKLN